MKEKRWNGTDSEKTDLICKLTVDNILFLSEKRLPNVSNKKNAKYEEFIDLLSYGMLCGRTGSISDLSRGLQTGMPHNDDYTVRVRVPGGDWKDLFEYNVQVDMDRVQDASMVQFDMGSPVEVMVKKIMG